MNVLIATDAFPPVCGGSGWSTYELACGLRARGHEIAVVQPVPGGPAGVRSTEYDGFRVDRFGFAAPSIPYVRNYFKSEVLTRTLAKYLAGRLRSAPVDIVHAQHVMTTIPAVQAAKRADIPVVATVRDYWPVCYWSDLLHTSDGLELCPECTVANMRACIRPRAGRLWPLALPLIPYMRANLAKKRAGLAAADAVIAVSHRIAADLLARAPELAATRLDVIPNAVNIAALRDAARAAGPDPRIPDGPFALYLGKLAPNKGTGALIDVVVRSKLDWPLIVAGDGPERAALERQAQASGRDVRFTGWIDNASAARLLGHASILIFPSRGPESLSRVLLEASALGVAIAAMDTGGTREIVEPEVTGLLSKSPDGLARDVARLRANDDLRRELGRAARARIEREFDAAAVVARVEALYRDLVRR
jgi:glycogen(starch) synthase